MAKTPLVLCPGLLNDEALWSHQIDDLADIAEIQVPDLTVADSMSALAAAVLEQAPERFALAGLSMGGYVSFEIMRQAPHRVERLALFDTTARPDTAEAQKRRLGLIGIAQRGGFSKIPPQLQLMQLYPPHVQDERISGAVLSMAKRVGSDAYIRQQTAILSRPDSRPDLPTINCPTLVVCGRQDGLTPPEVMEEISQAIPGAEFVLVDEAGHLTPIEQPQVTAALLRNWLQG